ncbi:MAG: GNAT family N-acetyltransferase [Patescibacteria group bacterium]|nr:GNAT family N-acetyltransferase [Patescibacteria group bacterium]
MRDIVIRVIKSSDYRAVRKIDEQTQLQYLGEKWKAFTLTKKEDHLVSRKKDFSINVNSGFSLVATIDKIIIGFLFAYELPFLGIIHIYHIAIEPKYQGKGIGILMYKKLITVAKSRNIKRIGALINKDNPNSIKLHKEIGFTLTDVKKASLEI